jgi:hypothetical protein
MERRVGQVGPTFGELTLQTAACSEPPAKRQIMTLGLPINMRANGVRTLAAWCLGRGCNHHRVLDVSAYADDLPVPIVRPEAAVRALQAPGR